MPVNTSQKNRAVNLAYALGLSPSDAIHYFERRGYTVTFNWHDLWQEQHARAFTVAGVTRADVLADIYAATAKAIAEGQTQKMFAEDIIPLLKKKGWWGKKQITDPDTGDVRWVRQGTPARVDLIYRQNTAAAFNAGRYKQQVENADAQPYWMYNAVLDQRTRVTHAALDGKVFRADDPFWDTHYPPNGWGCRCSVTPLSARSLRRYGLTVEDSTGRMVERTVETVNPRTGVVEQRRVAGIRVDGPQGQRIMWTDVGHSYNPGKTFYEDLAAATPVTPSTAGTDWQALGLPSLKDMPQEQRLPAPELLPKAATREEAAAQLALALGFTGTASLRTIDTPLGKRTLWRRHLPHIVEKESDARERYANFVLPTLLHPHEVWLFANEDGYLRENYIAVFQQHKYALLVVVRINKDGSLVWNMMQRVPKGMDSLRKGWLLHKR